jgi:hypothetical protein
VYGSTSARTCSVADENGRMGKCKPRNGNRIAATVPGPVLGGPGRGKKNVNRSPISSRKRWVSIPAASGKPSRRGKKA